MDPDKPQKRLADLKFEKQLGREDPNEMNEDDVAEVLDLDPNIDLIKPRQPGAPDFSKQLGRPEKQHLEDDDVYIHDFEEEAIPNDPAARKVIAHNFGLGKDRFDNDDEKLKDDFDLRDDGLDLDPQLPERKIKGHVAMDAMTVERFKERLPEDPFYDD